MATISTNQKNDINSFHEGIQILTTNYHHLFMFLNMLPHFSIIPQQQKRKKPKKSRKREKYIVVSLCFHGQKIHQRDVVIPLFDNPIVKKLETYTKHSQFSKMKV